MRVICTSGSVGAPGEPSPGATRPEEFPYGFIAIIDASLHSSWNAGSEARNFGRNRIRGKRQFPRLCITGYHWDFGRVSLQAPRTSERGS
jgi:hypothetical protein